MKRCCDYCGEEYPAKPYQLRHGTGRFCSVTCGRKARKSESLKERFWRFVQKTDTCWLWIGGKTKKGYGVIGLGGRGRKSEGAHRVSYMLHHGAIPDGMLVCHTCDNPPCVNPDHLFLGTYSDNAWDKVRKGRHCHGETHHSRTKPWVVPRGETHCMHLHPELVKRGTQQKNAKFTEEEIAEIRRRYAEGGISYSALARLHGSDPGSIGRIIRRERWSHVA